MANNMTNSASVVDGSGEETHLLLEKNSGRCNRFLQYLASHSKMWLTFLICIFYVAVSTPLLTQQDSGYYAVSMKIKIWTLYILILLLFVFSYCACTCKCTCEFQCTECECPSSDWKELCFLGILSLSYHICGILWEIWDCEEILRGESPDNGLKTMDIIYHILDMLSLLPLVFWLIPRFYTKDSKPTKFQKNHPIMWASIIITSVTFTTLMLLSAITEEYMEVFQHSRHNPEEISGCHLKNSSTYLGIIEYETRDETNSSTFCKNLENYWRPLTYPLVIEFYMLASQMLICVSQYKEDTKADKQTQIPEDSNPKAEKNVDKSENSKLQKKEETNADQQNQIIESSNTPDCEKLLIVFSVIFLLLSIGGQLIVDILLNYCFKSDSICDILLAHYAVSLSSYLFCIVSLFVFRYQLSKVKEKEIGEREWPDILKDALIIIPTLGNFFFQMFTIFGISTEITVQPQWLPPVYGLLIADAILNILETFLTALFLLDVQNKKSDALGKCGSCIAGALGAWNFLKWGIDSFIEAKRLKSVSLQIMYFNERWSWVLLIYYPLCIFFRFHCAKLFFSLRKNACQSLCCTSSTTTNQTVNA